MSIFGMIKNAVFGAPAAAAAPVAAAPAAATPAAVNAPVATAAAKTPEQIDAYLASIAEKKGADSNYQTSIVDLMKLLDLDSSLSNRRELAKELGYTGDTDDTATMNIWLHEQVMAKLAS